MRVAVPEGCPRCGLRAFEGADDCRSPDPICPMFGTHSHLWNGNEDESRAAYTASTVPTVVDPPTREELDELALDLKRTDVLARSGVTVDEVKALADACECCGRPLSEHDREPPGARPCD